MVISSLTLQTKWIARPFLLIYFLLSISTANASFLCQGAEASSHLEFNPVGQCLTACQPEAEQQKFNQALPKARAALCKPIAQCSDSPVNFSAISPIHQFKQRSKLAAIDIDPFNSSLPATTQSGFSRANGSTIVSQLPQPQALTALRTVILLH